MPLASLMYPFDGKELLENKKSLRRELLASGEKRIPKRIAVLGGSTTNDFCKMMEIFLLNEGIEPTFYQSEYAQFWQDAMFGNPELDDFHPDLIYLHTSFRNLQNDLPEMGQSEEEVDRAFTAAYGRYESMWKRLREVYHCPIIQNNFEFPGYRLLGNRDCWDPHGAVRFVNRMNEAFASYAAREDSFYVNDIQYVSACFGLDRWLDDSVWYLYKYACALEAIPVWAFNTTRIIKSLFGRNKKVLALDLDNTLWGGVVGDDGVDGIEIGEETATAESFRAFQTYVKKQKSIGVMLTVASKNDLQNALDGLNHPDGVLRPEDFIVIKADWENKDRNLMLTAAQMDLGVDSFVFADDNPTERALVAGSIPGVAVPEMTSPDDYIRTLDRNGYFEVTVFSADDAKRNEMYRANAERAELALTFGDYTEYLRSLDMRADILPFPEVYLARITQLTNKSNQFNLTTRRYTEEEIRAVSSDGQHICLYGKLWDRFGDNGVVSVVIGRIEGDALHMELWLMSCRVLKKDMEFAMLDTLVKQAKEKGLSRIVGYYFPTAKNGMVKELYAKFGFAKTSEDEAGNTVWELPLKGYEEQNHVIRVNASES
ncbi:MAG: HAD-IIIC family phosphatase [Oscillospiraceae bacterium]|nr:HAD-IIIC family phosphatase [Oscillospiraceae bacterium]